MANGPKYSVVVPDNPQHREIFDRCEDRIEELFGLDAEVHQGMLGCNVHLAQTDGRILGRDGLRYVTGRPQDLEKSLHWQPVVVVGTRGRPGEYEDLWRNSTFSDGVITIYDGLTSGLVRLNTHPEVPAIQSEEADAQRQWVESQLEHLITDQVKWEWLQAPMVYGFSIWEVVGSPVQRLKYIRQWTIDRWIFDENEELTAVKFAPLGEESYTLPIEKLVIYSHLRSGTHIEGIPALRFAGPHILAGRELERLRLQAADLFANGYRVIESEKGSADAGDDDALVRALDDARAKDGPILALPPGKTFRLISAQGQLPAELGNWIQYHDSKAALATGVKSSVAVSSDKGGHSYASLDVMDRQGVRAAAQYGKTMSRWITKDVIPLLLQQQYGDAAILPSPVMSYRRGREALDPSRAGVLVQLINNKAITLTPDIENYIREEFGFAPLPTSSGVTKAEDTDI